MMNLNNVVHIHNVKFGLKHKTKTISKCEHLIKKVFLTGLWCVFSTLVFTGIFCLLYCLENTQIICRETFQGISLLIIL